MLNVPPWTSARGMFVSAYVCSMAEVMRYSTYSLLARVEVSTNVILATISCSDASVISKMKWNMIKLLFIS